jgi:hypothetical protein
MTPTDRKSSKQFGSVVGSLAWASPIRLSGRGMETPAATRRSRSAYQRDRSDRPSARKRAFLDPDR